MATFTYKQRQVPRVDITLPPPLFPDPLSQCFAGGYFDGTNVDLYEWTVEDGWVLMDSSRESYWAKKWGCKKGRIFVSSTNDNGDLFDLFFWGLDIKMIMINNVPYTMGDFGKVIDSDTVTFNGGNPGANKNCLIFAN